MSLRIRDIFQASLFAAALVACSDTTGPSPPSEVGAVVAAVGTLRTTCVKSCGADAPDAKLTVRASGVEATYTSNFYAGCPGSMDKPPFVPFDAFFQLESSLSQIISQACRSDAGPRDAGTCELR